jgi:hypothetical protein
MRRVGNDDLSGNSLWWLFEPIPWFALSVVAYVVEWDLACALLFCVFLFTAMGKAGRRRG